MLHHEEKKVKKNHRFFKGLVAVSLVGVLATAFHHFIEHSK